MLLIISVQLSLIYLVLFLIASKDISLADDKTFNRPTVRGLGIASWVLMLLTAFKSEGIM